MDQKQIFADPEEKKLPKDLNLGPPEETSEEQAEGIGKFLADLAELIADSQKLFDKLSANQ